MKKQSTESPPKAETSSKVARLPLSEEAGGLALLKELKARGVGRLVPVPSENSFTGYAYPEAAAFYGAKDGAEAHRLEALASVGRLDRTPFDTYCVCRNCRSFHVKIEGSSDQCPKAHLRKIQMIHHYRCAWTAPESEFASGRDLICPKCRRLLETVGVDYDRPGLFYLCSQCGAKHPEEGLTAQCGVCKNSCPADDLPTQSVYAYVLKPEDAAGGAHD